MNISLQAIDTLFFRDGKPFTMGDDNVALGVFPPAPSVLYGALRSAYFACDMDGLSKVNSQDDPTSNLHIRGFYLSIGEHVCFPIPYDCVRLKSPPKIANICYLLKLADAPVVSSCRVPFLLKPSFGEEVERLDGGLLDLVSFNDYLRVREDNYSYVLQEDYVLAEPRIGNMIDRNTGAVFKHFLYRVGMRRLESEVKKGSFNQKVSLIVDFDGLDLPEQGLMRLGGEGKAVSYSKTESVVIDTPVINDNRFKLYLATPAIFKNGWLPSWIDENSLEVNCHGLKLRLLTASIGKYFSLGGFDMAQRKSKVMRRAVPAGSVYYFELVEGDVDRVIDTFHGSCISDYDSKQGYGLTFVGGVQSDCCL